MLNGLNILPSYTDYFNLTPATTGLNTASIFMGGILGPWLLGLFLTASAVARPSSGVQLSASLESSYSLSSRTLPCS